MTGLSRSTDPMTSVFAGLAVDTQSIETAVYSFLLCRGKQGATTEEISDGLQLDRVTVSPRMRPLVNKGYVIESDIRRKGKSGKSSIVWIAKEISK